MPLELIEILRKLPKGNNNLDSSIDETRAICTLLQLVTKCDITRGHVDIIGSNHRYVLYASDGDTIPAFILMLGTQKRRTKHGAPWLNVFECSCNASTRTRMDESVCIANTDEMSHPCDSGSTPTMLNDLKDVNINNHTILTLIHPFLRQSPSEVGPHPTGCSQPVTNTTMPMLCITRCNGHCTTIPVDPIGLQRACNALRRGPAVFHKTIITQSSGYTLTMIVNAGTFRLCLFETEKILRNVDTTQDTIALATLVHSFNRFDSMIETIQEDTCLNKTGCTTVTGMVAVAQFLLKSSSMAVLIRSIGERNFLETYSGMDRDAIYNVLSAMALVSDNNHVARIVSQLHGKEIVSYVSDTALLGHNNVQHEKEIEKGMLASKKHANDFRIFQSGSLIYDIAHKNNASVADVLHNKFHLNFQEISTALYSGISFCNGLSYGAYLKEVDATTRFQFINNFDFPGCYDHTVKHLLETGALSLSNATHPVEWTLLKHGFYVQHYSFDDTSPTEIECHITNSGVIFFRCKCDTETYDKVDGFVGVAYIIPSLVINNTVTGDETQLHKSTRGQDTPLRCNATDINKLVQRVRDITNEKASSVQMLLSNAAETLIYINAICIHNSLCYTTPGHVKPANMTHISKRHHNELRNAWLHTNILKASNFCNGVQNELFYTIYARLTHLSRYGHTCMWATLPYL
jgi:hypothetical protein